MKLKLRPLAAVLAGAAVVAAACLGGAALRRHAEASAYRNELLLSEAFFNSGTDLDCGAYTVETAVDGGPAEESACLFARRGAAYSLALFDADGEASLVHRAGTTYRRTGGGVDVTHSRANPGLLFELDVWRDMMDRAKSVREVSGGLRVRYDLTGTEDSARLWALLGRESALSLEADFLIDGEGPAVTEIRRRVRYWDGDGKTATEETVTRIADVSQAGTPERVRRTLDGLFDAFRGEGGPAPVRV